MKIVCSWCRKEGKSDSIGEKAPFEDGRETHGICLSHRDEVQARWWASRHADREGPTSLFLFWTRLLNPSRKQTRS